MAAAHIQPSGVADAGIAGETAGPPPVRRKRKLGSGVEIVLLTLFAVVMLFPVLWMLETALKETKDIYATPAKVITYCGTGSLCQSYEECAGVSLKRMDVASTR